MGTQGKRGTGSQRGPRRGGQPGPQAPIGIGAGCLHTNAGIMVEGGGAGRQFVDRIAGTVRVTVICPECGTRSRLTDRDAGPVLSLIAAGGI